MELETSLKSKYHEHILVLLKQAKDLDLDVNCDEMKKARKFVKDVEEFKAKLSNAKAAKDRKKYNMS